MVAPTTAIPTATLFGFILLALSLIAAFVVFIIMGVWIVKTYPGYERKGMRSALKDFFYNKCTHKDHGGSPYCCGDMGAVTLYECTCTRHRGRGSGVQLLKQ